MSVDTSYYADRAKEERRLGLASPHPKVRRVHLEMAAKYAALAGPNVIDDEALEPERRTA